MEKEISNIIKNYPERANKDILPALQEIQNKYGYLSEYSITQISNYFNLPCSKIYSIATYFDQFRFKENSKIHIRVCNGSSCFINGNEDIIKELKKLLNINSKNTSADGKFSIEKVPCFGACALAPLIEINGVYYTKLNKKKLSGIINELKGEI